MHLCEHEYYSNDSIFGTLNHMNNIFGRIDVYERGSEMVLNFPTSKAQGPKLPTKNAKPCIIDMLIFLETNTSLNMPPLNHLPAIITPSLIASIRGHPQLPRHSWYFIAGVTLSVINRPDEIPKVFKFAIEQGVGPTENIKPAHPEQLQIARKLREGLIKSAAIVGLPKVCS